MWQLLRTLYTFVFNYQEYKVWSNEVDNLREQVTQLQCSLEKFRVDYAALQQQNDGMALALAEKTHWAIEENKTSLKKADEAVKSLEERNQKLVEKLNESSPTSELLKQKQALGDAKMATECIREQSGDLLAAMQVELTAQMQEVQKSLCVATNGNKELSAENKRLTKIINEDHPADLAELKGKLDQSNYAIERLVQQNEYHISTAKYQDFLENQNTREAMREVNMLIETMKSANEDGDGAPDQKSELSKLLKAATK